MSASDVSTPPLPPFHLVDGVRDLSTCSIGALDASYQHIQPRERLHITNPTASSKTWADGASNISHGIDEVIDWDRQEDIRRYRSKLNRLSMVASVLSFVNALGLVGSLILTPPDWAAFIDPILDSILPQPSVDTKHLDPLPPIGISQIAAWAFPSFMGLAEALYAMKSINGRKKSFKNDPRSAEHEFVPGVLGRYNLEPIEAYTRASLSCFFISVIVCTGTSKHEVVIRRTMLLGVVSILLWTIWEFVRLVLYSRAYLNRCAQHRTTSNFVDNNSGPTAQDTEKRSIV